MDFMQWYWAISTSKRVSRHYKITFGEGKCSHIIHKIHKESRKKIVEKIEISGNIFEESLPFFLDSGHNGKVPEKMGVAFSKSLLYSLGKKTTEYFVFRAG